jgi:hypothetical protein
MGGMNKRQGSWFAFILLTIFFSPVVYSMEYGTQIHAIEELKLLGSDISYAVIWVGWWNVADGSWHDLRQRLEQSKQMNVTPVIIWYYWAEDISPTNIENSVTNAAEHYKSKERWTNATSVIASLLDEVMQEKERYVVIETEFNKGGTETYLPFDDYLLEQSQILRSDANKTKLIVGFGNWGKENWKNFEKTINYSDYVGFQTMKGSTRQTKGDYLAATNDILQATRFINTSFNKPSFLYDLALSSYPDETFETVQNNTVATLFSKESELQDLGMRTIIYREWYDNPNMPVEEWFGEGERHWGMVTKDGKMKPAAYTFLDKTRKSSAFENASSSSKAVIIAEKFSMKDRCNAFVVRENKTFCYLWANGELIEPFSINESGTYLITVTAMGEPAQNIFPLMTVAVSDTANTFSVKQSLQNYTFSVQLEEGTPYLLRTKYTNDAVIDGEDRNLLVYAFTFEKQNRETIAFPPATKERSVTGHSGSALSKGSLASTKTFFFQSKRSAVPFNLPVERSNVTIEKERNMPAKMKDAVVELLAIGRTL